MRILVIWRALRARPRLALSILSGVLLGLLLPAPLIPHVVTRTLIAWNIAALAYLALALHMMAGATHAHIRSRACSQDEGRYTVLLLVITSSVFALFAVAVELAAAKEAHGALKTGHAALAGLTVFSTWCVNQTMFALHYAHDYYTSKGEHRGLCFPGTEQPDYFDFLYAAAIIGTSGQTADVSFDSAQSRRVGLAHSVLSFFFNTIVLAFTINLAAGMI
jgi:uncharacterized membrane protein